jgi:hypothetical protein
MFKRGYPPQDLLLAAEGIYCIGVYAEAYLACEGGDNFDQGDSGSTSDLLSFPHGLLGETLISKDNSKTWVINSLLCLLFFHLSGSFLSSTSTFLGLQPPKSVITSFCFRLRNQKFWII